MQDDILKKQKIEEALKNLKNGDTLPDSKKDIFDETAKPLLNLKDKYEDKEIIEQTNKIGEKIHQDLSKQSLDLINRIYSNWESREDKESQQRETLTKTVLEILNSQVILNFVFLIFLGIGVLEIDKTIVVTYFTAFVAELVGIVIVVMKYFYNERTIEPLKIIKEVLVSISNNNIEFNRQSDDEKVTKK